MSINYDKDRPELVLSKDNEVKISHNHSQNYNTSYLYNPFLSNGDKSTENNNINREAAKISGCMGFFKTYATQSSSLSARASAECAAAGDEVILKSLTHPNI